MTKNYTVTGPDARITGPATPMANRGKSAYNPGYVTIKRGYIIGPDKLFNPDPVSDVKSGTTKYKYSTGLLVEDEDTATIDAITKMVDAKAVAKWPGKNGQPTLYHSPLVNCNTGDNHQEYLDAYHKVNAGTYRPPVVYQPDGTQMSPLDEDVVRSGAVVTAVVSFYTYDNGRRGVACRLESLRLTGEYITLFSSDADSEAPVPNSKGNDDPNEFDFL